MKWLWGKLGILAYWLVWPALWFYLHGSHRTRVIIEHGGKILITKDWLGDGRWNLPGGGLEKHENPADCAVRELKEETGLDLKPEQLKLQSTYVHRRFKLNIHETVFAVRLASRPAISCRRIEILDASWANPAELNSSNMNPDARAALDLWSPEG